MDFYLRLNEKLKFRVIKYDSQKYIKTILFHVLELEK